MRYDEEAMQDFHFQDVELLETKEQREHAEMICLPSEVHAVQLTEDTFRLSLETQEVFVALYLGPDYQVLGATEIARGKMDDMTGAIRRVLQCAVLFYADQVLLACSHPSGELLPSKREWKGACMLQEAAKLLGIRVIDHVFFQGRAYVSMNGLANAFAKERHHPGKELLEKQIHTVPAHSDLFPDQLAGLEPVNPSIKTASLDTAGQRVKDAGQAVRILDEEFHFGRNRPDRICVLYLTLDGRMVGSADVQNVSGASTQELIDIVFRTALRCNATAMVVGYAPEQPCGMSKMERKQLEGIHHAAAMMGIRLRVCLVAEGGPQED